VLVNTYWIRFPCRGVTFDDAVANSQALFAAAKDAGVRRVVHVSVSNASMESPLGYYRGKALVEQALREAGVGHAIVRPTLVVGPKDVLTNNIAWFIRRFPLIAVPSGDGYLLQPVTLADTERIIADAVEAAGDIELDAAGPDTLTFREYLAELGAVLGRPARFVAVPPAVMIGALGVVGAWLRDTILTGEELAGLQSNMLVSHAPPLGRESVLGWLRAHGAALGAAYMNDTVQRFSRAR